MQDNQLPPFHANKFHYVKLEQQIQKLLAREKLTVKVMKEYAMKLEVIA